MAQYAFIKNGDVVRQVEELEMLGWSVPEGGPNAFIADFLANVREDDDVLLLSSGNRYASSRIGRISAVTYKAVPWGDLRLLKPVPRFLVFLRSLIKLVKYHPSYIICGRTGSMLWASYLVSILFRVPMVHSRHNRVVDANEKDLYRKIGSILDRWVITRIRGVICHGPYLREQILDIGVPESRVFEFDSGNRDFYENAMTVAYPERVRGGEHEFIVLFVGRIEKNKGVFDLFDACKNIGATYERLKLVYVGAGSALALLQELVKSGQLQEKVQLLGRIDHHYLGSIMKQCSILVTPTWSSFPEGRCMAAMEGLVMGLPVIAPDFGPFPYLVEHEVNGLLYTPDSVDKLQKSILTCLENRDLYRRLREGAAISGEQLLDAQDSFWGAIEKSFRDS